MLRATAPIYTYSNGPSGSTTAFMHKVASKKLQLGVRNTNNTTLFLIFFTLSLQQWVKSLVAASASML